MAEWRENQLPTPTERPEHWVMYFDDSLKLEGAGAGVLLISPKGEQLKYVLQIFWKVSNNEAVDVKSAPHTKHTASRISWLNTHGPGVRIRKCAGQFSLKHTKDENS
jgi:hypothetical protein